MSLVTLFHTRRQLQNPATLSPKSARHSKRTIRTASIPGGGLSGKPSTQPPTSRSQPSGSASRRMAPKRFFASRKRQFCCRELIPRRGSVNSTIRSWYFEEPHLTACWLSLYACSGGARNSNPGCDGLCYCLIFSPEQSRRG